MLKYCIQLHMKLLVTLSKVSIHGMCWERCSVQPPPKKSLHCTDTVLGTAPNLSLVISALFNLISVPVAWKCWSSWFFHSFFTLSSHTCFHIDSSASTVWFKGSSSEQNGILSLPVWLGHNICRKQPSSIQHNFLSCIESVLQTSNYFIQKRNSDINTCSSFLFLWESSMIAWLVCLKHTRGILISTLFVLAMSHILRKQVWW